MKGGIKQKVLGWFGENCGIECQEFDLSSKKVFFFYVSCMVNKEIVLSGLLLALRESEFKKGSILSQLQKNIFASVKVKAIEEKAQVQEEIFNGAVVIAVEGEKGFLSIPSPGYSKRAIAEPPSESVLRGPREGFIEDIETNLGLVRKRLKTPNLAVKNHVVDDERKQKLQLFILTMLHLKKLSKKLKKELKRLILMGLLIHIIFKKCSVQKKSDFLKELEQPKNLTLLLQRF